MSETAPVVLVQLDPEAPLGLIAPVASRHGLALSVVDATAGLAPDALADARGLVVLGSTAAAVGEADGLVGVIRERVRAGRPVLAIDAGAALLAVAVGGAVRAGQSHEFGYVDLSPTAAGADDPVVGVMGTGLPVMEWHDDAIELPDEVVVLAQCGRARVQAFRAGGNAYGLRFHPGATAEIVRRWAALRGKASNNPAIRVRVGTEIVRHQTRAEQFGQELLAAWLTLIKK
jgi:GMP synthase (glutamine-hydrolysing)